MFGLSSSQIAAVSERLFYVISPTLITYGLYAKGDEGLIATAVVGVVAAIAGVLNNRTSRLADRAAKATGGVIVTTPEIAASTKSPMVVSSADYKVTEK